ncbi:hypothetical protein FDA94_04140 [Herbidospora galbida]|uniref:DUF4245 domain-containing protein n=1 Tax=Herbidospora galbida TaxID=2575442 RepID=A0A4V6XBI0_9ACTN|nr:hypothetical protein [Herbidospora galbida]TKK90953.1 hypothetical protein FDA94_04140 [Herbidospora galbida]
MLEHDLREAMAAETATLAAAPDLAERVERRARSRRWRTRLAVLLVPFLAAAGWFLVPQALGTGAVPADQIIDGVLVTHLPPGLIRAPEDPPDDDDFPGVTALWSTGGGKPFTDGGDGISVSVYRSADIENTPASLDEFGAGEPREIAGKWGRHGMMMGIEVFYWVPRPGVIVMVMAVGADLEPVVEGIVVPG